MIFLVQFGINKNLLIFSKTTILLVFEKIYPCLFIPNCTRNHVITYTNREELGWLLSSFSFSNTAPIPNMIKPKLKVVYFFIFLTEGEKKHDENSYRKFSE